MAIATVSHRRYLHVNAMEQLGTSEGRKDDMGIAVTELEIHALRFG
jgi:hypothetical protein